MTKLPQRQQSEKSEIVGWKIIMDRRYELKRCASMLSYILNMCSIATISEKPMGSNEQGFSGAAMIQQDLGKRVNALCGNQKWMENVAGALAEIHGNNMNRGIEMPWLPHAFERF